MFQTTTMKTNLPDVDLLKGCEISYRFPVQKGMTQDLACKGAFITKIILEINRSEISEIQVQKNISDDEPFEIDFFGGEPYFAGLAKLWDTTIIIYVPHDEKRYPSVMYGDRGILSWDTYESDSLTVSINTLVYKRAPGGGILRELAPATMTYQKDAGGPVIKMADKQ